MSKKIRIEIEPKLFKSLLLVCSDYEEPALQEFHEVLTEKLNRMILRQEYTKYKTSQDPEEKEKARHRYLDGKGIPEDFQWE